MKKMLCLLLAQLVYKFLLGLALPYKRVTLGFQRCQLFLGCCKHLTRRKHQNEDKCQNPTKKPFLYGKKHIINSLSAIVI